jgi:hypothetical protein
MSGAIPPLPQYVFMAWCSVKSRGTILHLYDAPKAYLICNYPLGCSAGTLSVALLTSQRQTRENYRQLFRIPYGRKFDITIVISVKQNH